jgi:acyl-CoA synthetase (AMP-forming)/AMP-acid ligase II
VADEAGEKVAPNVIGALVVRGGHVMQGYWRNAEATAKALRPGPYPWERVLHTGDLFRMDEDGYCTFVGRKDDIIKSRGEKVSPKEIENVLYALPGITEAAVVGVPDEVLGRALKAIIVVSPESTLSERDVVAHCIARLEDFMVPRLIEFRESLPKTATGKIQRAALQAEVDSALR